MDLQTRLSEYLWNAIKDTYEARNFTGAIQNAMYYLGDFVREKTDSQSDGVQLMGDAFGGKSPKLRVNPLQTESDRNVQQGIYFLGAGLYHSIRNPRSHSKYEDTEQEADAIILFIDYLMGIIGASKGTFSKTHFLDRVFDPSFVPTERYANVLVDEIPAKHRFDVMVDVFKKKGEAKIEVLKLFCPALMRKLDDDAISRLVEIVSEEEKLTEGEEAVRITYNIFPSEFLVRLDESARLRGENKFLQSVTEGQYIASSHKCTKGAFGTWCQATLHQFLMKEDFAFALLNKLASNVNEQDYCFQFFSYPLFRILNTYPDDNWMKEWAKELITEGLKTGDRRFYDLANAAMRSKVEFWKTSLADAFSSFQEAFTPLPPLQSEEDLPF